MVVVIISVIIGFAVLAIDTGPEEQRREGNRLAALLQLAAEEAVMNGREYRVVLRRHGYAFEQLREGKWQGAEGELLRPRQLPAGLELELVLEGQPVALAGDDAPERETVALFLLSSGEITPFELTLAGDQAGGLVAIRSDGSAIESRSGNFE